MSTGLFLGAGASFEIGLPLVWDLTKELKAWLTHERLSTMSKVWRDHGTITSNSVMDEFRTILNEEDLHYENILGYFETQMRRVAQYAEDYNLVYGWIVELVYWILYLRHTERVRYIETGTRYLDGIIGLSNQHKPLWIFSLNHDLIVECLAAKYKTPISSGFSSSTTLPRRDNTGAVIGDIRFELVPIDKFESSDLCFFPHGSPGINLLKIHGALDIFTSNDGRDLLKRGF
jgi:hypothetical protein